MIHTSKSIRRKLFLDIKQDERQTWASVGSEQTSDGPPADIRFATYPLKQDNVAKITNNSWTYTPARLNPL